MVSRASPSQRQGALSPSCPRGCDSQAPAGLSPRPGPAPGPGRHLRPLPASSAVPLVFRWKNRSARRVWKSCLQQLVPSRHLGPCGGPCDDRPKFRWAVPHTRPLTPGWGQRPSPGSDPESCPGHRSGRWCPHVAAHCRPVWPGADCGALAARPLLTQHGVSCGPQTQTQSPHAWPLGEWPRWN